MLNTSRLEVDERMRYFAYGSNMSEDEMKRLCECDLCERDCDRPAYSFVTVAVLPDYELAFNRCSTNRKCGVADVVVGEGKAVEGVVYDLPEECICALRKKEGYPIAYGEVSVVVKTNQDDEIEVLSYTVKEKSNSFIPPSEEYKNLIVEGAKAHGLSGNYIKDILDPISTSDKDCRKKGNSDDIESIVRSCIDMISRDFKCNPWSIYSEPDIHARLYCHLKGALGKNKTLYSKLRNSRRIILLYREFPTRERYSWTGKKKRRANFDLAILRKGAFKKAPFPTSRENFSKSSPEVAIEVKLDVTDRRWKNEMNKSLTKLKEIEKPKHRFILFFARRQTFKFFGEFQEWIEEHSGEVCVKYARAHPKKWLEDSEDLWF